MFSESWYKFPRSGLVKNCQVVYTIVDSYLFRVIAPESNA
jgi:hypothetical protein